MKLATYSAPAYWASYLINGDASGLDATELEAARAFEEWTQGHVVSCEEESRISLRYHDAWQFWPYGGDCLDYHVLYQRRADQ